MARSTSEELTASLWPIETIIVLQQLHYIFSLLAGAFTGVGLSWGMPYFAYAILAGAISFVAYLAVKDIRSTALIAPISFFPGTKVWSY